MTGVPDDLAGRILDGSPDAVVVCDRAGTVHYWNASAERTFGFARSEALGGSMDLIVPERFRARHWAGWEAAIEAGASRYAAGQLLAVPALHKDGRQISIEFSIQFVMAADARVNWVAAFIRDVTERHRREKALRAELSALKAGSG